MARHFTYDETKVKELRMSIIMAALEVMQGEGAEDKWSPYKREMVLKMSPRVLPLLNEVTGKDGKDLNLIPLGTIESLKS